jgi:hypothetical protein
MVEMFFENGVSKYKKRGDECPLFENMIGTDQATAAFRFFMT